MSVFCAEAVINDPQFSHRPWCCARCVKSCEKWPKYWEMCPSDRKKLYVGVQFPTQDQPKEVPFYCILYSFIP